MRTIRKNKIITDCGFGWPPEITGDGPFYAINPYVGCAHNCSYCWSRDLAKRFGKPWGYPAWFVDNIEEEWKNPLVVENALELLEKELETKKPGRVLLSSMTDPYQPIEQRINLTRSILQRIRMAYIDGRPWHPIILTKAFDIDHRNLHLMQQFVPPYRTWLGVTIDGATPDKYVRNAKRAQLIVQAKSYFLRTFVSLEPWIEGNDLQKIIQQGQSYVDFWIIGSLNKAGRAVNPEFYKRELPPLIEWMDKEGINYYIKKELRRAAGMEG